MKTLYIILGLTLAMLIIYGSAPVQFTAAGCAFGWLFYENKRAKEARR